LGGTVVAGAVVGAVVAAGAVVGAAVVAAGAQADSSKATIVNPMIKNLRFISLLLI
jgi:hypothetical protein